MLKKGASRITTIVGNWDPIAKFTCGAFVRPWRGGSKTKSARLCQPSGVKLEPVSSYTAGTSNKTAWWVLNGVDQAGNTHVRELMNAGVDAVKFSNVELLSMDIYVAKDQGNAAGLCVVVQEGTNNPDAELGMLAWGTNNQGDFLESDANNPRVVSLGSDVFVTKVKLAGRSPFVEFIVN